MRKLVVMAFVTMDGVMQGPGGPKEDRENGFAHGGWVVPHFDEDLGKLVGANFAEPFDLLLGRKTYDTFVAHWPEVAKDPEAAGVGPEEGELGQTFDRVKKYVATHRPESLKWENSEDLGKDPIAKLQTLKKSNGPLLLTQGSSELVHLLFKNDLVDEIRLITFPLVLGRGKRLFDVGTVPAAFALSKSKVTKLGVIVATYVRKGSIDVGSFELPQK